MDPRSRNGIIQFVNGIINIIHKLQETFVTAKSIIVDFPKELLKLALSTSYGSSRDFKLPCGAVIVSRVSNTVLSKRCC